MNVTAQQWQELEPDLDRLLDLAPEQRESLLIELQGRDPARAAALRGWLADIERSEGLLEAAAPPAPALPDDVPWRLLRPLGRGGMGEVWLAERADGAFERRVAVKFLRTDRLAFGDRLVRERELLARLRHPGIAMLLDGGVAPDGAPYLVTEWIDGIGLDQWVRDTAPVLRARVTLLRRIAEAVGYAHANLIVHRDLKPANVVIDRHGQPHLLDFGIARLLDEAEGATATQDRALTPAFAAPEQLRGEPITTRSDIYALGGLLYWLLSGRTPHGSEDLSLAELVERVCGSDPRPPSSHADASATGTMADLDAIALTALARDPRARYPSADAFAADLQRWLDGEPVSARLPTRLERTRRFLRRYRVVTALTLALVLVLLAGIAATSWQTRATARERDLALAEADRSEQLLDTFASLFRKAEQDERLSASDWLDRAAQVPVQATHLDERVRWRVLAAIGAIEQDRGQAKRALPLLERVVREARVLAPDERAAAQCRLGSVHAQLGRNEAAVAQIDAGLALTDGLVGSERLARIDCLVARAALGTHAALPAAETIAAARAALAELDRLGSTRDLRWRRASALYALATQLDLSGNAVEAAAAYEQVSRLDAELGQLETLDHAALITAQAGALNRAGRVREADALYAEGTALAHRVGGNTPNLATDLVNHAMVKHRLDDAAGAATLAERALRLFEGLGGSFAIGHANAYAELGKARAGQERYEEAGRALDEALRRMRAITQAPVRVLPIRVWQARVALARGDLQAAQAEVDALLPEMRATQQPGGLSQLLQVAARIAVAREDLAGAEARAREAVQVLPTGDARLTLAVATAELTLAEILHARDRSSAEARERATRVLSVLEPAFGAAHSQVRTARSLAGS